MKLCLSVLALVATGVLAEGAVIVHPSNTNTMDVEAASRLFLGKAKSFADGSIAVPISQSDNAMTEEFNGKVLGKNSSQLKAYWSQLVFTGKGTPPKEVSNDAEVIKLVAENPSFIGYVSSGAVTGSVKVLVKF